MSAISHRPLTGSLRQCFTRNGKPKKKFASKAEARAFNKQQGSSLQAYECIDGHWHLGTQR